MLQIERKLILEFADVWKVRVVYTEIYKSGVSVRTE